MIHNYAVLSDDGSTIVNVIVTDDEAQHFMVALNGERVPIPDEIPDLHHGIFRYHDHTLAEQFDGLKGFHLCCGAEGPWIGWTTSDGGTTWTAPPEAAG